MENKNIFNWAAIVLMVTLAISALWYVSSYSESIQPGSFRSFGVTGEGKAVVVPDVARFTFGVISEGNDKDIAKLQTDNTTKMNKIIEVIKKAGVDAKDIKTENYNLSPRYSYCNNRNGICPPAQIAGYSINQTVSVKVRDFSKVGGLLSAVVNAGATNISQVEFTVDDINKVKDTARGEAIKQAKAQAETIAKAGGFRVGKLLSLEEITNPIPYMSYDKFGRGGDMMSAAVAVPAPSIEPGSQEISIQVVLRYEIK